MSLRGAGAIVTGGGRGIGAAVARALTAAGARVTVFARSSEQLDRVVAAGAAELAIAGDVAREEDVARLFDAHRAAIGACDVLVNNAGILVRGRAEDLAPDRFRRVARREPRRRVPVRAGGDPRDAGAAARPDRERRVDLGRRSGPRRRAPTTRRSGALIGLTKCLAEELRADGVQALAVSPGSVDTDMLKRRRTRRT